MTFYAIVDRETGAYYGKKPKLYDKVSTAKGVLTAEGFSAPKFRWAVVAVKLTIAEIVPDQKLGEADFDLLVSAAEAELDKIKYGGGPVEYFEDDFRRFHGREILDVEHFHGAYGRLKYV